MWKEGTLHLQDVLEIYRQFLLLNFVTMNGVLSEDLLADWLQANWEIIVESKLQEANLIPGLLDVYGDGADCNGSSSRVSLPKMSPSCAVHVQKGYVLHSFGTLQNDFFIQSPPFDYVKGENSKAEIIVKLNDAQFEIGKTYDSIAT
jgi:hypothetical protein